MPTKKAKRAPAKKKRTTRKLIQRPPETIAERVRNERQDAFDEELEAELEDSRIADLAAELPANASPGAIDRRFYFEELLRLQGEPPMTRFLAAQLARSHSYDMGPARRDFGYREIVSLEEATAEAVAGRQAG